MSVINKIPQEYDVGLFVDRKKEIEDIHDKIKVVSDGIETVQTIRITGERGVGKTWLLRHLHRTITAESNQADSLLSIYIDFDQEKYESASTDENRTYAIRQPDARGLQKLLIEIAIGLNAIHAMDAKLPEQSFWLGQKLKRERRTIIWLLDGLFEVPEDFLDLLETYFLNHLAEGENQIIVMTGRGRAPLFIQPNLNILYAEMSLRPLKKTAEGTEEEGLKELFVKLTHKDPYRQLGKEGFKHIDVIYRISGGYLRTALLLAQHLVESQNLAEGAEDAIDDLLSFITDSQERKEIRQHLEALSLLNRWWTDLNDVMANEIKKLDEDVKNQYLSPDQKPIFEWGSRDSDSVVFLNAYTFFTKRIRRKNQRLSEGELKKFYDDFIKNVTIYYNKVEFWRVRNKLQKYQLIRWEVKEVEGQEYPGYFTEEALRYPIAYALQANKPGLWQWLHYVGWSLFKSWANKFGKKKKYGPMALAHKIAMKEATPHASALA